MQIYTLWLAGWLSSGRSEPFSTECLLIFHFYMECSHPTPFNTPKQICTTKRSNPQRSRNLARPQPHARSQRLFEPVDERRTLFVEKQECFHTIVGSLQQNLCLSAPASHEYDVFGKHFTRSAQGKNTKKNPPGASNFQTSRAILCATFACAWCGVIVTVFTTRC